MPIKKQPKLEVISGGANLNRPPSPHELEISIFGPGYGECVVVHLGNNHWFIVDSCIDIYTKEPAALAYFKRLNIDPSISVKQVIATHWHDDHIRGFAETFSECKSAQLILSTALQVPEFHQLVCLGAETMIDSSGVNELHQVIEIMLDRKENGIQHSEPVFAIEGRRIWHDAIQTLGSEIVRCEIFSLSPSDSAVLASQREFINLLSDMGRLKTWVQSITPNRAAVVIQLKVGNFSVLLGADLEESGDPRTGWSAVVRSHSPLDGKASVFKIPHHGSKTAHHAQVWQAMLDGDPIAVVTPCKRGNVNLPTENDVLRLKSFTTNAFMTSSRKEKRTIDRDHTVEKTIKEAARKMSVIDGSSGHVRIRFKDSNFATVELFGEAGFLESSPKPHDTPPKKAKRKL
jgi:hypothetical protein